MYMEGRRNGTNNAKKNAVDEKKNSGKQCAAYETHSHSNQSNAIENNNNNNTTSRASRARIMYTSTMRQTETISFLLYTVFYGR